MSLNSKQPSAKQIVETLMVKKGEEQKSVNSRLGSASSKDRTFLVYSCPRGEKCRSGGTFSFPKGSGYTNSLNHLKSCVADVQMFILLQRYTEKQMHLKKYSQFQELILVTERERAMYTYVNLTDTQSLPLSLLNRKSFDLFLSSMSYFSTRA